MLSQLQLSTQQLQAQINACKLELLAEVRTQQSGLEWTGITPFLAQLFLPFMSKDRILGVVHAITALQGTLVQHYCFRISNSPCVHVRACVCAFVSKHRNGLSHCSLPPGHVLQVHARRVWVLILFGDVTARVAERLAPSVYSMLAKELSTNSLRMRVLCLYLEREYVYA